MSEHGGGAPGAVAAAAVHPYLCCVFVILLLGVPGWARSSVCDGASGYPVHNAPVEHPPRPVLPLLPLVFYPVDPPPPSFAFSTPIL